MNSTFNEIEREFISKGIMRDGLLLLGKDDAISFAKMARNKGKK